MSTHEIRVTAMPIPEDRHLPVVEDGRKFELDLRSTGYGEKEFIEALGAARPGWIHNPAHPKIYGTSQGIRFFSNWGVDRKEVAATIVELCEAKAKRLRRFYVTFLDPQPSFLGRAS